MSAEIISVLGTEYIQNLKVDNEHAGNIKGDTTEVTYISSLGGICAIQLSGPGGDSGLIGRIPATNCIWYGRIRGKIPSLTCGNNDLNCTTISVSDPSSQQLQWDKPEFPSALEDPDATLFDFDRDIVHSTTRDPRRRFFRYLSVFDQGECIKGLSVYMSRNSIVGLGAHFTRRSQFSGHQCGCELYFPLHDGEQIAYAWLRFPNAFAEPALMIQTTSERTHTFGPCIAPHLAAGNSFKWLLLGQEGCIKGLYYENVNSGQTIRRLGVIGDGTATRAAPLPPQYHICEFPSPLVGSLNGDLFLSSAVLNDLKVVDVCHVNERCTGMLICYHNDRTVVLGQWYTSGYSRRTRIYRDGGPTVTNIYFRISKSSQIVTAIDFSSLVVETSDAELHTFSIGEHIAWWFSGRHDKILPWTGHTSQIPEKSMLKQHL
ncbi:hypothetical protein ONS95_010878 [Cadophora gregata]|uniref:uncharacterized protein n=1 Tax=Cadophora gregata TaxID=51156 RepID=UPI0026DA9D8A|nr:uncharacterized protein ONS95_010878 [Cadophora gregata]KAK0119426.1 hypothetical protein ONS95_010878 [Cadophora gregata]KAK0120463.1 hypothetical protein ONS96_010677 [Cadophora gregata f. sp. sojae]